MATLSQALNGITNSFFLMESRVEQILKEFENLVRENGTGIYVVESSWGGLEFDLMGKSTDWNVLFDENSDHTTLEMFEEGFIFGEEEMYVYVTSLY